MSYIIHHTSKYYILYTIIISEKIKNKETKIGYLRYLCKSKRHKSFSTNSLLTNPELVKNKLVVNFQAFKYNQESKLTNSPILPIPRNCLIFPQSHEGSLIAAISNQTSRLPDCKHTHRDSISSPPLWRLHPHQIERDFHFENYVLDREIEL